jgi:hypothetical protein
MREDADENRSGGGGEGKERFSLTDCLREKTSSSSSSPTACHL